MSDFVAQDFFFELWDEIVKRHLAYIDSEESIIKLENRKKLEDCLKKYLCNVQHDRKFFLPETDEVLKKSIRDMEDFGAQRAITAFESISQYANNLLTKPWRKEFRNIKMFSGFYQHEIKSNLLDAEKLFEAMGYRRLSNDILILDEPICPDQVLNVTRDAMTAYIELRIIKHIYTGLDAIGIKCSWLDIYRYREKYTGGTSQAVKALAISIEEKRYRYRQKLLTGDNYGYIDDQSSTNYFASNQQHCLPQCQCSINQLLPPVSRHRPMAPPNDMCYLPENHPQPTRPSGNSVYSNMTYPVQHQYQHNHRPAISSEICGVTMPQMSHSRSLDHYRESANHHHNILPHRHSFDQQQQGCPAQHQHHHTQQLQQHHTQQLQQHQQKFYQQPQQNVYESPYDCIDSNSLGDGSSSISYAAVAANAGAGDVIAGGNPYNVSGNRFPLPLNISNQITAASDYVGGDHEPTYAHIADQHLYSSVSKLPRNCAMNSPSGSYNSANFAAHCIQNPQLAKGFLQSQRTYQTEKLINFEEPSILPPNNPQPQIDSHIQYRLGYDTGNIVENPPVLPPPPVSSTCHQHYIAAKSAASDELYVYAKPLPKENRKPPQNASNVRKSSHNYRDRDDTTDLSYESANDDSFIRLPVQEDESNNHPHSPTQFSKNQDGVGSFETWDYVFQNLERSAYSKNVGEREDFLVESLDLDSLNINNDTSPSQISSAEKKRSNYTEKEKNPTSSQYQLPQHEHQTESNQKSKTFVNSKYATKNNTKMEILASASSSLNNSIQKPKSSMDNNTKKTKSSFKHTNATSKSNNHTNKTQLLTNDNKMLSKTINNNNNNNDSVSSPGNGGTVKPKKNSSSSKVVVNDTKKTNFVASTNTSAPPSHSTQINCAPEWSCRFCTFLNPNSKRICEMCCRSKDFESATPSAATGGTTVAHNTTTCA